MRPCVESICQIHDVLSSLRMLDRSLLSLVPITIRIQHSSLISAHPWLLNVNSCVQAASHASGLRCDVATFQICTGGATKQMRFFKSCMRPPGFTIRPSFASAGWPSHEFSDHRPLQPCFLPPMVKGRLRRPTLAILTMTMNEESSAIRHPSHCIALPLLQ